MINVFRFLYRYRRILWATTLNDIRSRYTGTTLGLLWVPIYPILFLSVYAAVYIYILKVRLGIFTPEEYVALIFCGLIPFLGFAEVLGNGVGSVVANANLIKNTLYPIELIPVRSVCVSQFTQGIGILLLICVVGAMGKLTLYTLLLPVIWILQILFMVGLIWFLSSINVLVRDLQNIIPIVLLLLMLLSPIAYTIDMVPPNLQFLSWLNPLSHFIWAFQDVLVLGKSPDLFGWSVLVGLSLGFFLIGYFFFSRMKIIFVDNI